MTCDEIRTRLSEYLDGAGEPSERREIAEHLGVCLPCRRLYRELEELGQRVRQWDPERRPERDLWPRIAARLDRPEAGGRAPERSVRGGSRIRRWVWAAAATLAVGIAVPVAVEQWPKGEESPVVQARRERDQRAYDELIAAASLARVADGTLQPRRDLEQLLASQRGRLDAATVATLEQEADRLQQAIGEIQLALEEQPENLRLRLALASRYRQESDLLQRIGRV